MMTGEETGACMSRYPALLLFCALGALTASDARAQFVNCADPNAIEQALKDVPRTMHAQVREALKKSCDSIKPPGGFPPPQAPQLRWKSAECFPLDKIPEHIAALDLPDDVRKSDLIEDMTRACRAIPAPPPFDPTTSHADLAYDAQFLPDGRSFLSIGRDKTLRLWDVAGATKPRTLYESANTFWRARLSPDGANVAVSSPDEPIRIIDVATGKTVATLEGTREWSRIMQYFRDGRQIMATASEKEVGIFDAATGKLTRKYPPFRAMIEAIAIAPDEKTYAVGTSGSEVRVWQAGTGRPIIDRKLSADGISSLTFSPDGSRLVVGTTERFEIYDMKSGDLLRTLPLQRGTGFRGVGSVFLPEKDRLLTCSSRVTVWNTATGAEVRELMKLPFQCYSIALSPDGKTALVTHDDRDILLLDVASSQLIRRFGQPKPPSQEMSIPLRRQ